MRVTLLAIALLGASAKRTQRHVKLAEKPATKLTSAMSLEADTARTPFMGMPPMMPMMPGFKPPMNPFMGMLAANKPMTPMKADDAAATTTPTFPFMWPWMGMWYWPFMCAPCPRSRPRPRPPRPLAAPRPARV